MNDHELQSRDLCKSALCVDSCAFIIGAYLSPHFNHTFYFVQTVELRGPANCRADRYCPLETGSDQSMLSMAQIKGVWSTTETLALKLDHVSTYLFRIAFEVDIMLTQLSVAALKTAGLTWFYMWWENDCAFKFIRYFWLTNTRGKKGNVF